MGVLLSYQKTSNMHFILKSITLAFAVYLMSSSTPFTSACLFVGNCTGRSDESGESIKAKAFVVCDANQDGSLTWDEVEICEEQFCDIVAIDCPDQDQFEQFDSNNDGNLSWEEYMNEA